MEGVAKTKACLGIDLRPKRVCVGTDAIEVFSNGNLAATLLSFVASLLSFSGTGLANILQMSKAPYPCTAMCPSYAHLAEVPIPNTKSPVLSATMDAASLPSSCS